jgi:hypothetical protein
LTKPKSCGQFLKLVLTTLLTKPNHREHVFKKTGITQSYSVMIPQKRKILIVIEQWHGRVG